MLTSPAQAKPGMSLQMLFDSDTHLVVHIPIGEPFETELGTRVKRHGFEIVDKRTNRAVFLVDDWARHFMAQITAWQQNAPSQEAVEETLDCYCELAVLPVVVH
jgi:hypothetical protein